MTSHAGGKMNASIKDWFPALSSLAAAAGVILTALKFRSDLRLSREQRERDLRWKQAQAAKELNDEMLEDPESRAALDMLDFAGREFKLPPSDHKWVVTESDLRQALNPKNPCADPKLHGIRYCFDSLFYYFAMMHHHIDTTLVLEKDMTFPLSYYIPLLAEYRSEVEVYLKRYRLCQAREFLKSHAPWEPTPAISGPRELASPQQTKPGAVGDGGENRQ